MLRFISLIIVCVTVTGYALAQDLEKTSSSLRNQAINVYISTSDDDFDIDFIKNEIPVINYVRDQGDAQLHIIVTSQKTGSNGYEYTYYIIGQQEFAGMADTLKYNSMPDDQNEEIKDGLANTLKMGLMRYVSRTPLSEFVKIDFEDKVVNNQSVDKWNNWVFNLYGGGSIRGEKKTRFSNLWGGFSVFRITPEWKIEMYYDMGHTVEKFLTNEGNVESTTDVKVTDILVAKSINEHWSTGIKAFVGSQSYSNYKFKYSFFPEIEYDIFPYSESTRKQIRFMYGAGHIYHLYNDTTIYNKTEESLWGHRFDIAAEILQTWGSLEGSLGWKNYFHDWSKNNLFFSSSLNIRIAKGLQFRISGNASMVHNQLSLKKGGATYEETLLRKKELATQYKYSVDFSIKYTFGSIYNNVVNPRFDDLQRW